MGSPEKIEVFLSTGQQEPLQRQYNIPNLKAIPCPRMPLRIS